MKPMRCCRIVTLMLLATLMGGCAAAPPDPLLRLSPDAYPRFSDDLDFAGLDASIQSSLTHLKRLPSDRPFTAGRDLYTAAHLIRSLEMFRSFLADRPEPEAVNAFIRSRYRVYRSTGGKESGAVLFTGYFEPLLKASLTATARYRYPIYGPPKDLLTIDLSQFSPEWKGKRITGRIQGSRFIPYHDREAIDVEHAISGKAPVLAWLESPVDRFFLHIQGSGKVLLADGRKLNIQYHSQNGQPYRSIGKLLIDEQKIPRAEMSMQKIREYLDGHPDELNRVLNYNPSYVFFSIAETGPRGALNVPLTPQRSLALDRRIFPLSALMFITTEKPELDPQHPDRITRWVPFSRFMVGQDTGGAIKGPGRADIFWGNGHYAEMAAGHLKHSGSLFLLILDPSTPNPSDKAKRSSKKTTNPV